VRRLVVASTTRVYGPHPDNPNFLTEDEILISRKTEELRGQIQQMVDGDRRARRVFS